MKWKKWLVLAITIVVVVIAIKNWSSCAWYGYQTDRTTRYAYGVGCLVEMPTGWTPRAEIRTAQ